MYCTYSNVLLPSQACCGPSPPSLVGYHHRMAPRDRRPDTGQGMLDPVRWREVAGGNILHRPPSRCVVVVSTLQGALAGWLAGLSVTGNWPRTCSRRMSGPEWNLGRAKGGRAKSSSCPVIKSCSLWRGDTAGTRPPSLEILVQMAAIDCSNSAQVAHPMLSWAASSAWSRYTAWWHRHHPGGAVVGWRLIALWASQYRPIFPSKVDGWRRDCRSEIWTETGRRDRCQGPIADPPLPSRSRVARVVVVVVVVPW